MRKVSFLSVYFCGFTTNVVATFFLSPISALLSFQLPARQRLSVVTKPFNHTTVFTARLSDLHLNQCVCACVHLCMPRSFSFMFQSQQRPLNLHSFHFFPSLPLVSSHQRRSSTQLLPAASRPFETQNVTVRSESNVYWEQMESILKEE